MLYLVSGSRSFTPQSFVTDVIHQFVQPTDTLMHGTARGVDSWCAHAAHEIGATVFDRPAQWDRDGRSAGFKRNTAMIDECLQQSEPDHLRILIFWDGVSRGTEHFLQEIHARKLSYHLFFPPTPS